MAPTAMPTFAPSERPDVDGGTYALPLEVEVGVDMAIAVVANREPVKAIVEP